MLLSYPHIQIYASDFYGDVSSKLFSLELCPVIWHRNYRVEKQGRHIIKAETQTIGKVANPTYSMYN